MASGPGVTSKNVNKVEINGVVKLDLTEDTVTPATLAKGKTAHDSSGTMITGTMEAGSSKEEQEKLLLSLPTAPWRSNQISVRP